MSSITNKEFWFGFGIIQFILNGISIWINGIEHWLNTYADLVHFVLQSAGFIATAISPNEEISWTMFNTALGHIGSAFFIQLVAFGVMVFFAIQAERSY